MGEKLKAARKAAGLKQSELAAAVGCRPEEVSRWENGTRAPRADMLKSLAEALGCKIDDII